MRFLQAALILSLFAVLLGAYVAAVYLDGGRVSAEVRCRDIAACKGDPRTHSSEGRSPSRGPSSAR